MILTVIRSLHYSIFLMICVFFVLVSTAHSTIYLYQLPDGSRVITDRPKYDGVYKRIRRSHNVDGLGQIITGKYKLHDTFVNRQRYTPLITQYAQQHNVDVALIKAVIHAESYFNPNATSIKGASGLMQLMPNTAAIYGVYDLYNPAKNLEAGVKHLHYLLNKYQHSLQFAIAAYNAGESAVSRYNGIPPYIETEKYVKKVLRYHSYYSRWP